MEKTMDAPVAYYTATKLLHDSVPMESRDRAISEVRAQVDTERRDQKLDSDQMTSFEDLFYSNLRMPMMRSDWLNRGKQSTDTFIKSAEKNVLLTKELGLENLRIANELFLTGLAFQRGSSLLTPVGCQRFLEETTNIGISSEVRNRFVAKELAVAVFRPDGFSGRGYGYLEGTEDVNLKVKEISNKDRLKRIDQLAQGLSVDPKDLKNLAFEMLKDASDLNGNKNDRDDARHALGFDSSAIVPATEGMLLNSLDNAVTELGIDREKVTPLINNLGEKFVSSMTNKAWSSMSAGEVNIALSAIKAKFSRLSENVRAQLQERLNKAIEAPEKIVADEKARVDKIHKEQAQKALEQKVKYEEVGIRFTTLNQLEGKSELTDIQRNRLEQAMQPQYWNERKNLGNAEIAILRPDNLDHLQRMLLNNQVDEQLDRSEATVMYKAISENPDSGYHLYCLRPDLDSQTEFVRIANIGKINTPRGEQVVISSRRSRENEMRRAQWKYPDDADYWDKKAIFVLVRDPSFPKLTS